MTDVSLPERGESLWDTKLNNSINALAAESAAAAADAENARSNATVAIQIAQASRESVLAGNPDAAFASLIEEDGSATQDALLTTIEDIVTSENAPLKRSAHPVLSAAAVKGMASRLIALGPVTVANLSAVITFTGGATTAAARDEVKVFGFRFPHGTRVSSIDDSTHLTLSQAASGNGTGKFFYQTAPPVMAAPPTFTKQSDARWYSGAGVQTVLPNSSAVPIMGGPTLSQFSDPAGDQYIASPPRNDGTRFRNPIPLMRPFDVDGLAFEFGMSTGAGYRLWVLNETTGRFEANSELITVDSAATITCFVKVEFGAPGYRRCFLEILALEAVDARCGMFAMAAPVGSRILPSTIRTAKLAWIGDSFGKAFGGPQDSSYGIAYQTARRLGIWDVYNVSIGGTGPATANGAASTDFPHYGTRIAEVIAQAPDVVVYQGSINDGGAYPGNASTITARVTTDLTALLAGLPEARVIMTSPMRATAATATDLAVGALYKAVCDSLGVPFVDAAGTIPFNTGSGDTITPTGDGNADQYSLADHTHLNSPGHTYNAMQLARGLAPHLGLTLAP